MSENTSWVLVLFRPLLRLRLRLRLRSLAMLGLRLRLKLISTSAIMCKLSGQPWRSHLLH
jgi:hypothetical protein